MQKVKEQLILVKGDYDIIMKYLRGGIGSVAFDRKDMEELHAELKKAKLVNHEELPQDVVRLNSIVTIKEEQEKKLMTLKLVTPNKADVKQKHISIMSPIGTALIGFRKGQQVEWDVPSGRKKFSIVEVINEFE
jgi:regulator of nucleoside diphosphate kinase